MLYFQLSAEERAIDMQREILSSMAEWEKSDYRKPLVLMGARQVGKTWLMEEFARRHYPRDTVYVNFMDNDLLREQFTSINIDARSVIETIRLATGKDIVEGKTLLILDEIQESPRALTSLKFLCEEAPRLAVMAAGSLLGLALNRKKKDKSDEPDNQDENKASFPVGKVDFLDIHPLTFREFLMATGQERYLEPIDKRNYKMIELQHSVLTKLIKSYCFVGGMPEAVKVFAETGDFSKTRKIQKDILTAYDKDFAKHAKNHYLLAKLRLLWNNIPAQLAKENKKFIYKSLRAGARAREYEEALQWLKDAGMVYQHFRVNPPRMPLRSYEDYSAFKLFMHDVGLLGAMSNLPAKTLLKGSDIFTNFNGSLTEQYVLQELIAANVASNYWTPDSGDAEVDFVIQGANAVFPLEAKAGTNTKAKSLKVYRDAFKPEKSYRVSLVEWRPGSDMEDVPLYAISSIAAEIDDGNCITFDQL